MPTKARTVISGICCHVTQRGNYRQPTFFCDEDRELYLDLVSRRAVESQLQLLGWCLMSNHVHWIVCPLHPEALARTFRRAHSEYSQYVNRKHQRASGHLWQNRFYSCLLGDDHLWRALRYVECNPVRAQLANESAQYQWSSAKVHTGLAPAPAWMETERWNRRFTTEEWTMTLQLEGTEEWLKLREATRLGKAWADAELIKHLETQTGRQLSARRPGRPRTSYALG